MGIELTILVLLILGVAFMTLEAFAPAFGLLGLGGAISFLAALQMLRNIDTFYGITVDLSVVIAFGLIGLAVCIGSFYLALRSRRTALSAGAETLPGTSARVLEWEGNAGRIQVQGEIWAANGPALSAGDSVTIISRNNLILTVKKD